MENLIRSLLQKLIPSRMWWHTPVIPALGRLRQDAHELNTSKILLPQPLKSWDYRCTPLYPEGNLQLAKH
jgi:hypothetical protein